MAANVTVIESLSQLPKDRLYRLTYDLPDSGRVYAYQRPDNGCKWRMMYFVEVE